MATTGDHHLAVDTPAVLRPALCSVTRRTLTSMLARERSSNFCRLRTLARSPACDAVKIRCRRRRTRSSTCRQLTNDQSVVSPSGPFTTPTPAAAGPAAAALAVRVGMVSNLPFGSGVIGSRASQAHQIHVSTLSGRSISSYPASYPGAADGGRPCGTRFPASFRPPALACWIFLRPLRIGLPCGRLTRQRSRLDLVGVVVFHMSELRPGWVSSEPRGRRCDPSALPQPVTLGWDEGPWALASGSAPRGYPRRTLRWGQALHTGLGPTLRHQSSLLWVASTPLKRPHVASARSNTEGPMARLPASD